MSANILCSTVFSGHQEGEGGRGFSWFQQQWVSAKFLSQFFNVLVQRANFVKHKDPKSESYPDGYQEFITCL